LTEEEDVSNQKQERDDRQDGTPDFASVDSRLAKGPRQPDDEKKQTNTRHRQVDPGEKVGNRRRRPQEIEELCGHAEQGDEQAVP